MTERLAAAAEDIFLLFERTIAEYETELCRLKDDNHRKQKPPDKVLNPRIELVSENFQISSMRQDQDMSEILQMKEEPPEHGVKQETEQLPV